MSAVIEDVVDMIERLARGSSEHIDENHPGVAWCFKCEIDFDPAESGGECPECYTPVRNPQSFEGDYYDEAY